MSANLLSLPNEILEYIMILVIDQSPQMLLNWMLSCKIMFGCAGPKNIKTAREALGKTKEEDHMQKFLQFIQYIPKFSFDELSQLENCIAGEIISKRDELKREMVAEQYSKTCEKWFRIAADHPDFEIMELSSVLRVTYRELSFDDLWVSFTYVYKHDEFWCYSDDCYAEEREGYITTYQSVFPCRRSEGRHPFDIIELCEDCMAHRVWRFYTSIDLPEIEFSEWLEKNS